MPEWITWVFDGIGTTIFSIAISALIGGAVGYKIGVHKNVKQKQAGGDSVKQRQVFTLENEDVSKDGGKIRNNFQQNQKAGDNAEQVQIGGIKCGR